jgi:hypothetical protein
MNLSEAQKWVGKENFADAIAITRRDFLTGTVAAGIGVVGTGDEGSVLLGAHNPGKLAASIA